MAPIRMSGMNSGLDTESIVKALVSGYDQKKQKVEKNQTKLEWSQEIWKGVNSKVKTLYTSLDKVRFSSSYKSKKTTVSDQTKATVSAGSGAVNGTQKLKITKMAQAGYLTGGKVEGNNGDKVTSSTKLTSLGVEEGSSVTLGVGDKETTITMDGDMTVKDFVNKLQDAGVNASFDESNARFFISAKDSGAENDFTLKGTGDKGIAALQSLGIYTKSDEEIAELTAFRNLGTLNDDGTLDEETTRKNLTDQFNSYYLKYKKASEDYATAVSTRDDLAEQKASTEETKAMREGISEYLANKKTVLESNETAIAAARQAVTDGSATDEQKALAAAADAVDAYETAAAADDAHKDVKFYVNEANKEGATASTVNSLRTYNETVVSKYGSQISDLEDQISEQDAIIASANETMESVKNDMKDDEMFSAYADTLDSASVDSAVDTAIARLQNAITELDSPNVGGATRINGQDAEIYLNGAQFTSSSNNFSVNGLSINLTGTTGDDEITITTSTDTDAIYDKVKDFLEQYNSIVNELQGLYNADSAKGYEPLTEDEKAEMSDTEIEKWETKIKDSLLRRDSTLGGVISTMTTAMSKSYNVTLKDGTTQNMALSSVGVHTLGFLNASANEQYAYHIDGDEDDSSTSGSADKLRAMIESDPDAVADLMSQVAQGLYKALDTKIGAKTTELSSAYTIYNDKQMESQAEQYKKDIKEWEERITTAEDMYYSKFTAMEKALANLNSSQSALTGMIG
ncbi:MAG: flagellar filament capping protein FliD [Lachnospiraceae bacterium]|nr:flagellar filament capping protein FliD [Lachnospiraceae bacterium]